MSELIKPILTDTYPSDPSDPYPSYGGSLEITKIVFDDDTSAVAMTEKSTAWDDNPDIWSGYPPETVAETTLIIIGPEGPIPSPHHARYPFSDALASSAVDYHDKHGTLPPQGY